MKHNEIVDTELAQFIEITKHHTNTVISNR